VNRIDVSKFVDLLLTGAAPERRDELTEFWGTGADRVHLTDGRGFDIEEIFGVIKTTEITLREIWILSFAAWRAIEAYSGIFFLLTGIGVFKRDEVASLPGQAAADAAFDTVVAKALELRKCENLDSFEWPKDIPQPTPDNTFSKKSDLGAYNLACIAAAYIFLHEIRHVLFARENSRPLDRHAEELECDKFARRFLLEKIDEYAFTSGEPAEQVRSKRALGIAVGKTVILEVTPLAAWLGTDTHPPVRLRVHSFLEDLGGTVTERFWISVASFLAATCRSHGRLPSEIKFKSARELALALADCL